MHSYAYQWNSLEMKTCLASTFLFVHKTPMFAGDVALHQCLLDWKRQASLISKHKSTQL